MSKDITYCTCVECPIECEKHVSHVPKGQKIASFAQLYRVCKPYIALLLDEAMEESNESNQGI